MHYVRPDKKERTLLSHEFFNEFHFNGMDQGMRVRAPYDIDHK